MSGLFWSRRSDFEAENRRIKEEKQQREDQFASIFTYNSERNYGNRYGADFGPSCSSSLVPPTFLDAETQRTLADRMLEVACTAMSSAFLLLTLPFTLPFSLKFVGTTERLVVMRLGRTKAVHGPGGTVLVLPWIDKATSVDLRVISLELPAVQTITADRGIVELVAVVFSQVTDPLLVHCAIQDVNQTLQSLAYTTLCRQLSKRMLNDLTSPGSLAKVLAKCQDELNAFVRPRGLQIERITASAVNVMRAAENPAMSVFQTLARSQLGKQLFGQLGAHLMAPSSATTTAPSSTTAPTTLPEVIIDSPDGVEPPPHGLGAVQQSTATTQERPDTRIQLQSEGPSPLSPMDDPVLTALLCRIRFVLNPQLVQRVQRCFRVQCAGAPDDFDIDLSAGAGWCGWTGERRAASAHVHFSLDKPTLLALVDGSLSPMSAYLDGRVQIRGSLQDAALLAHVAEAAKTIGMASEIV